MGELLLKTSMAIWLDDMTGRYDQTLQLDEYHPDAISLTQLA